MSVASSSRTFVRRVPFYYGWVIVVVAALGMSATMSGQTANISLFIDRFIVEFGLEDRSTISGLYGLGTFIASFGLMFVGRFLDRSGTRRTMVIVILLFVGALLWMASVNSLLMLFIGFILIRGLGQGALSLAASTTVANWFKRLRGRAMAVTLILFGLYQRWYIPFYQDLLTRYEWRTVWLVQAGVLLVFFLPVLWLFVRDMPEQFGLLPDGEKAEDDHVDLSLLDDDWTFKEAIRTPILWVFMFARMMGPALVTGIVFHQESLFGEMGVSPELAASTLGQAALIGAFLPLLAGYIVDRFRPSILIGIELVALISLMLLTTVMTSSGTVLILWAFLNGLVMGMGGVFSMVWVNLFGRKHQGEIRGFIVTSGVVASAAGPFLLATSFDVAGTYKWALYIGSAVCMIPLVLSFFVNKPKRKPQQT